MIEQIPGSTITSHLNRYEELRKANPAAITRIDILINALASSPQKATPAAYAALIAALPYLNPEA
tara:strand:- start:90 stop:284 length:195 start_codon:yes stop_codon:yes gene_type:complete